MLSIFEQIDGYSRLQQLLAQKLPEMQHLQVKRVFAQLIEIACDELNCSMRIDEKVVQAKRFRQPVLYSNRIKFLEIGLELIKKSPVKQSIQFLEMV